MMTNTLISILTLGAFSASFVQLQSRPESNPSGKLIDAAEVTYGKILGVHRSTFGDEEPEYPKAVFYDDGSATFFRTPEDSASFHPEKDGVELGRYVSRHEFNTDKGFFFSPDARKVAFYVNDQSNVSLFPLLDISPREGGLKAIRYPMAGMKSERLALQCYDFSSRRSCFIDAYDFSEEQYLTNVCWAPDGSAIYVQVLDRAQQNMHLNAYDPADGHKLRTLLCEHSDTWVEPSDPLYFIKGKPTQSIYCTDNRDGYRNLYLLDVKTAGIERLTKIDKNVEYKGNDGKWVYFTAPDDSPVNNYLWRISLKKGKVEQLTKEVGWHEITMASDCSYVDSFQNLTTHPNAEAVASLALPEVVMGRALSANGVDWNDWRLVKPLGFDPSKKYPIILYVYGGPHMQMVQNKFLGNARRWEIYMAQRGYAVFVMDNRGTPNHSTAYEHAIYRQCGVCEAADQMAGFSEILKEDWVDKDRVGIYGWSYGGFMTLTLKTAYPDLFKVAVAGGPVIDWKWYEVMYGERYMSNPVANPEGYAATSLIGKTSRITGKVLVIQGANDDTVVPLNALSFLQSCIDNGISIDYFTYPRAAHNMRRTDRIHLVEKIHDWFRTNL